MTPSFTRKDIPELIYILHNAPTEIALTNRDKSITPMNGYWYPKDGNGVGDSFETFHEAVVWLLNPFWETANGHPYDYE